MAGAAWASNRAMTTGGCKGELKAVNGVDGAPLSFAAFRAQQSSAFDMLPQWCPIAAQQSR
jgi:hypothetical protein